jgi:hypothetical protein
MKKQDKLLKFCVESDEQKLIKNSKTLPKTKMKILNMFWKSELFSYSEYMPLNDTLIVKEAKIYPD